MKRIPKPNVPDVAIVRDLSKDRRLGSFPALRAHARPILRSYAAYRRVNGDATAAGAPAALPLGDGLPDALRGHYIRPPALIRPFLETLRDTGSPDVCPMCGSLGTGTLDHVFPKSRFPEFAFFSLNLVPACLCNSKRRENLIGAGAGERVLHPYFDNVLDHRLVHALIQPSPIHGFERPVLQLQVLLPRTDPRYTAVAYHVENVIRPTQVLAFFDATWPKLARRPEHYFFISAAIVSEQALAQAVGEALLKKDTHYGTQNNWESMLFAGIAANTLALTFLAQRVNDLRNGVLKPDDL